MGTKRTNFSLFVIFMCSVIASVCDSGDYIPEFSVEVEGGPDEARRIAEKHGFVYLGEIMPGYYNFAHSRIAKRSIEGSAEHHQLLANEPQVRSFQQQRVLKRVKRDVYSDHYGPEQKRTKRSIKRTTTSLNVDDPRWPLMWYLNRGGGLDMNVAAAWSEGYTGKGVVVTILDDGLEKDHPDIKKNYDPLASYDVNGHDEDPMPRYDLIDSNRHGTRCAGEVAAEANNSICALGIAYDAYIGGVRMLDGDVTDAVEARSLSLNPQHIDIFSASWGPDDDGKTVDGPGELATRAFVEGVTKGRGGKGSIFIWASGNGGRDHDDCNCDGYTNSIWTLSISSATENGFVPWYSEACSSTLATTYSSGSAGERQIVTTDLHHSCTQGHTGTSASAPLAAAICALALEANPNLTWRDMQHIVVRTARQANLKADDWQLNGVGRNVSHAFGYGLMDAHAMVKLAKTWQTVPPQLKCEVKGENLNKFIPAKSQLSVQLKVTECPGVNYMEHVQARVTLSAVSRGDIQIFLISPSGTKSTLLALRPHDASRNGFHSWPFMSVHFWGEKPFGVWTLEVHNEGRFLGKAVLGEWSLKIYGTATDPSPRFRNQQIAHKAREVVEAVFTSPTTWAESSLKTGVFPYNFAPGAGISRSPQAKPRQPHVPATLSDWNLLVHGTKNNPESTAGAQQSPPEIALETSSSSPPPPVGHSSGSQGVVEASTVMATTCAHPQFIYNGLCLDSCPDGTYKLTSSFGEVFCRPCHYTCLTCLGPLDTDCQKCHGDALLHEMVVTGQGRERFCHPLALVHEIDGDMRWYFGLCTALVISVTLVVILSVCLFQSKSNIHMYQHNGSTARYTTLNVKDEEKINVDFDDSNDET